MHKILIVDDSDNIRFTFKSAFAEEYAVLTASDGLEAVALVKAERPDLVFLDINMPGISGVEALKLIKATGVPAVVWMLTGVEDLTVVMKTLTMGASGYITKPFDVGNLRRVMLNAVTDLEGEKKPSDKPWTVKRKEAGPGPGAV
ncbi:MAG: response regulator [Elusimicrobiales bacterium]|nr:response regulator [Elusimicrobiales bacterium]